MNMSCVAFTNQLCIGTSVGYALRVGSYFLYLTDPQWINLLADCQFPLQGVIVDKCCAEFPFDQ